MIKYSLIMEYLKKAIIIRKLQRCVSYCNPNGEQYQKLKKEKKECIKSLHLD